MRAHRLTVALVPAILMLVLSLTSVGDAEAQAVFCNDRWCVDAATKTLTYQSWTAPHPEPYEISGWGAIVHHVCPDTPPSAEDLRTFRVRGTDMYSLRSPTCLAAIHAGLISATTGGGTVTTETRLDERFIAVASQRNGISSEGGPRTVVDAFVFVSDREQGPAAKPSEPAAGLPARTGTQPEAAPPAFDFSGTWNSSEGVMTLGGTSELRGSYPAGTLVLDADGSVLTGIWVQGTSGQRCEEQRENTFFWGGLRFTASADGRTLTGSWGYCDDFNRSPWTATRSD